VNFQSDQFHKDFVAGSDKYENIEMMMLGLVLNHGVILDFKGTYLASSPDELSLINAAKFLGVTMVQRDLESIKITIKGCERTYKILFVIEFNSTRKRMTTVVRTP